MVELVSACIISAFGVGWCSTRYPWMSFVQMLAIAVFVGVAGVETMLRTVEFCLVPFMVGNSTRE